LIFDNSEKKLPVDAPEVHITRRVYRSGEGEYLINRQPARLKDIRDMFRGTGVGADAYSLIEQGKVDKLLQASARDRRAIFEEAAGISRFKAKKVEAQRRLERVEQNLLRLSDIVEEVENRLKTVRAQAGKARRYREYSERLQQLRTQIALVDWRRLTEQLAQIETELVALAEQIQTADAETQRLEAQQLELETAAAAAAEELHNCENQLGFLRQHSAQHQATIDHERLRGVELEEAARLHGKNLLAMSDKAGDVRSRLKATQAEVAAAQASHAVAATALCDREGHLVELSRRQQQARQQAESRRQQYMAQMQAAATLASQVEGGQTQLAAVQQAVIQLQRQLEELAGSEADLAAEQATSHERERQLAEQLAAHQQQVEAVTRDLAENRNLHASRAGDLSQLHGRQRGIVERAEVLAEFERTLEGIGAGVKELLARAGVKSQEPGASGQEPVARASGLPWSSVRGVVADFVQVGVEHAAAIDVALGDAAQAVVIEGGEVEASALIAVASDLAGRVMLIPSPSSPPSHQPPATSHFPAPSIELTADMASGVHVIARADKLALCPDEMRPLVAQLLGRTFIVRTLDDAFRLRAKAPPGTRVVTAAGELLDEQGAVAFGPRQSATSLVSRRSQLRAARLDLAVLDQQIEDAQRETAHLKREIERHEAELARLHEQGKSLDQQVASEGATQRTLALRAAQLEQQTAAAQRSLNESKIRRQSLEAGLAQASRNLVVAQSAAGQFQAAIAGQEQELLELDAERQQAAGEATAAKIELARCDQRLESLRLRLTQFEDDSRERERAIAQVRQQWKQAQQRQEASQLAALAAGAELAELALKQQSLGRQMCDCLARRDAAASGRAALVEQLSGLRRRTAKLHSEEHQQQLAAEQVRHERKTLADRMRDDYSIDLAAAAAESATHQAAEERAAVEQEIESLRRKIQQIGAVNLDALDELDELEQRFATLSAQHKDLTDAKESLARIIHKINADSRRLFLETLEAIRVNFQALYRKAFGGGKADIVLEEGVDVLDCGVEIIATPPGKPSFNNSLLSGGEKALTAVALLLAIFQFRPSPFCVLDEVDAPFDEANIGRFIDVLKDFLGWTRFVIVTHSKKTMTAATTLYGVTMQESGVSKRVSVRFDDVTDDGHIRQAALDRAGDEAAENAA
ncbi:MAG TPA: chromosome segregation protein SMC, partial [Pirellulaceae bacterium]|nr:chromosome segregation protein SMC [Pirellulaceae bacterium]